MTTIRTLLLVLLPVLASILVYPSRQPLEPFAATPSRILVVTAHPDDESFFFAPTILALLNTSHELYSLCLSTGNADGLGNVRVEELERSLDVLGVQKSHRYVIDNPNLQDNITAAWNVHDIALAVRPYVIKHDISTILTFDTKGVSGHPNHASLPPGIAHLFTAPAIAPRQKPRLFTLVSISTVKKYTGILGALLTHANLGIRCLLWEETPASTFASAASGYWQAVRAMREHKSQMVWFRWLYITFSRYMWVNEWVELSV